MKWLLTIICVNSLISLMLYPMLTIGTGTPMSWLLETGFLVAGAGSLFLLIRFRRSF
jgi:hypothetical protein